MFENTGVTLELFIEAKERTNSTRECKAYLAKTLGCSTATVEGRFRAVGYVWPRARHSTDISHTMLAYAVRPCVICGEDREVDRAHIVSNSDIGASSVENIVHLCPTHHRLWDKDKLTGDESTELEYFFSTNIGETRSVGTSKRKRWIVKRYDS